MMDRTRRLTLCSAILGLALVFGACQDLQVLNPNEADRLRALSNPSDVEALIAGAWMPYWIRTQNNGNPYHSLNTISGVMVTSVADNAALAMSVIPRPVYDNSPISEMSSPNRFPWYAYYSGLDNANEGIRAIDAGLRIVTEDAAGVAADNTERALAFAKFCQGLILGYLGMIWDQALIVTEDSDLESEEALTLRPYPEVIAAAEASMKEAIAIAQANQFVIPPTWINGVTISNQDLIKLANSFMARFLVLGARDPEGREQVDWEKVLDYTSKSITEDLVILHESGRLSDPNYKRRISFDVFNGFRMDNLFLGVSDLSGNFQEWLATPWDDRNRFLITTPDRRITGATPTSSGSYIRYRSTNPFRPERGTWRFSFYQFYRWGGEWRNSPITVMTVDEMALFRAEAYLRLGQTAQAVEIINQTRVNNGKLPPVTVAGIPGGADCVPKRFDGSCEDLLGALRYERILETTGLESPRDWLENRGWGGLVPGTILHFPVPGRELETLGLPMYTFGGGGPGSQK
jgi:hypothetical protein